MDFIISNIACIKFKLFQKAEVIPRANIVWLTLLNDILVNLKPVIYQPQHKKQMNPRLRPSVFNGLIKPETFEQMIKRLVFMAKRRKLKLGFYILSLRLHL